MLHLHLFIRCVTAHLLLVIFQARVATVLGLCPRRFRREEEGEGALRVSIIPVVIAPPFRMLILTQGRRLKVNRILRTKRQFRPIHRDVPILVSVVVRIRSGRLLLIVSRQHVLRVVVLRMRGRETSGRSREDRGLGPRRRTPRPTPNGQRTRASFRRRYQQRENSVMKEVGTNRRSRSHHSRNHTNGSRQLHPRQSINVRRQSCQYFKSCMWRGGQGRVDGRASTSHLCRRASARHAIKATRRLLHISTLSTREDRHHTRVNGVSANSGGSSGDSKRGRRRHLTTHFQRQVRVRIVRRVSVQRENRTRVRTVLLPPFRLVTRNFLHVGVALRVIRRLDLVRPLTRASGRGVVPISPIVVIFLQTRQHMRSILRDEIAKGVLVCTFRSFHVFREVNESRLLTCHQFIARSLSHRTFQGSCTIKLVRETLTSFRRVRARRFRSSKDRIPHVFLMTHPLSTVLCVRGATFNPDARGTSFLCGEQEPNGHPHRQATSGNLQPFTSIRSVRPRSDVNIQITTIRHVVVVRLRRGRRGHRGDGTRPRRVRGEDHLRPTRRAGRVSRGHFRVRLFYFGGGGGCTG